MPRPTKIHHRHKTLDARFQPRGECHTQEPDGAGTGCGVARNDHTNKSMETQKETRNIIYKETLCLLTGPGKQKRPALHNISDIVGIMAK